MKVLVTGAAGFIGSHLSLALAARGLEVVGVDSLDPYYSVDLKRSNISLLEAAGVRVTLGDLADPFFTPERGFLDRSRRRSDLAPLQRELVELLRGVDVVYHLAAQPGNSAAVSFESYLVNNVLATHALLEAAQEAGVCRFVNVATSSVYGLYAEGSEETPPQPISHYGVTKLAAEQLVLAQARRSPGIPSCSLRLFSVYGERERPDKLFPKLCFAALSGEPFPLYRGSESHQRSFTYVGDAVAGLVAVLERWEAACGEIFNIGSDQCTTTGEGIKIVESLLNTTIKIQHLPPRPGDQLATRANITKAKERLGYAPSTPLREGLSRVVAWAKGFTGQ